MKLLNEQEKRDALQKILLDLSKSQDILKDHTERSSYFSRLEDIYHNTNTENFRHFYSDIFACLSAIDADPSQGNLDILAQNMQTLKDSYTPIDRDIRKELFKLYDHTNLDIGRINYTKRITGETRSELARAQSNIVDLKEQLAEAETAHNNATEYLKNESIRLQKEIHDNQKKMQNEYITILGIFAAIVLAFTGGTTFSSSVLENIDKPSIYRLLAVVFILGLIIFSLIWLLIDFLRDINGKTIRKWWLIFFMDALLISGILFTFLAYNRHWLDDTPVSINKYTETEVSRPTLSDDKTLSDNGSQ